MARFTFERIREEPEEAVGVKDQAFTDEPRVEELSPVEEGLITKPMPQRERFSFEKVPGEVIPSEIVSEQIPEADSGILEETIEPVKRIPEIYQKEVAEGLEQMKQPGLLNKAFGGARFVFSPITAPVEALLGEPTENVLRKTGAPESVVQFTRGLVEGSAYMFTPSPSKFMKPKAATKAFTDMQKVIKGQKAAKGFKVMDLIKERRAGIDKGILDSEFFITKNIDQKLTALEKEALPFIRQKIKDPEVLAKIGRRDLVDIVKKPSKNLTEASEKVGKYYDESFEFLKDHGSDFNYIEDYVTQLWDIPAKKRSDVVNYFVTNNPFLKKRKIPTLAEGIKLGLTPKTTNISEMLRIYDQMKFKVAFNMRFADELKGLVDETGMKLIQPASKAPKDWVKFDHPALRRTIFRGKTKDKILLSEAPVKVHPEIAEEMNIIFGQPFSGKAVNALETVNAFTKKSMLSGSLFHHIALTESAMASGVGKKAISLWNPYKIYRALKHKDYEIFKKMPLAKDAIDHGMSLGALSDMQLGRVEKAFRSLEKNLKSVPIAGKMAKGLRKGNELWDRALWDYYHNTLKLEAYESQVASAMKRTKASDPKEIKAIKEQIAGFVNDSFGGQQWENSKVFGQPKMKQLMQWVLLAPDWTISTLKQAAAPVTGLIKGKPTQAKAGTKFWLRAAAYNTMIAQAANYYTTQKYEGKGKFTWENDPGHELNIFAGYNEDGTKRYVRTGKQFKEALEWVIKPEEKLGGKLSPVVRESLAQLTKHEPGSGYPTEFEEEASWESIPKRIKKIASMPIPFSLTPYLREDAPKHFMFALPASKGMTKFKTIKLFQKAIKAQDFNRIKRVYFSALQNNLNSKDLFKMAKAKLKADVTYEDKDFARDIVREMRGMDATAKKDLLKLYSDKGIVTEGIAKQLRLILTSMRETEEQKELMQRSLKEKIR